MKNFYRTNCVSPADRRIEYCYRLIGLIEVLSKHSLEVMDDSGHAIVFKAGSIRSPRTHDVSHEAAVVVLDGMELGTIATNAEWSEYPMQDGLGGIIVRPAGQACLQIGNQADFETFDDISSSQTILARVGTAAMYGMALLHDV